MSSYSGLNLQTLSSFRQRDLCVPDNRNRDKSIQSGFVLALVLISSVILVKPLPLRLGV